MTESAARAFALTMPGLAPLTRRELEAADATVSAVGNDGRADVVLCATSDIAALLDLRLAEDVFVEAGRTLRSEGDRAAWIAQRLWRPGRAARTLAAWARHAKRAPRTFRVVVRVLQERSFPRTQLRRELARVIGQHQPRWREADPAGVEVWAVEYQHGRFALGLRLSTIHMRQHGGRDAERPGALRPVVASAMVRLAGAANGVLLDPCCGSGTILAEAKVAGWDPWGLDVDKRAVTVARRNCPQAVVEAGDARKLEFGDGDVGAYVTNLPFGERFSVPGNPAVWLREVLGEAARVTRRAGDVVVLVPEVPDGVAPRALRLRHRYPIRLLGTKTAIWHWRRS